MTRLLSLLLATSTIIFTATAANAQAAPKAKHPPAAKSSPAAEPSPEVQDATIAAHRKTILSKIKTPPLSPFHPQLPKRIELPNGMIIFLQEDHELPLIDGSITIRGGSRLEPANKVGLVAVFGQVWRTGGTRTRTGDQLDDYLEARAAKVETGGRSDVTTIG